MDNAKLRIYLGNNLRAIRKRLRLSQREVGERLHITSQAIANYENGKRDITSSMLLQFANVYGVLIDEIIGNPDNSSLPPKFWDNFIRDNAKLEERLNNDFDVHIVGNVPQSLQDELFNFVTYLKHKYGYPKK